MTVDQTKLQPYSSRPWLADRPEAAEGRSRPANSATSPDAGDDLPFPLVSSPPLIPRVFPGL